MTLLIDEAARFQEFVIENGWEFYFIGGIAVQIWGEPRLTRELTFPYLQTLITKPFLLKRLLKNTNRSFRTSSSSL